MFDPIGGFLRIRELFITYLETAFRIGDAAVSGERRALLERAGEMCTSPLLEPLPRYKSVDWTLRDLETLCDGPIQHLTEDARRVFVRLCASGLFDGYEVRLYRHQAVMLERGSRSGSPGVVTSGTGSGKTEAFLLPVFAALVQEAKTNWPKPDASYLREHWWRDEDGKPFETFTSMPAEQRPLKRNPTANPFVPHRRGEQRTAAVRCLILYPMNALVEDQLSRLRKALDSDQARAVCQDELGGNRIFFGRYTSDTPVTGFNIHPRAEPQEDYQRRSRQLQRLFERMVQFDHTQRKVRELSAGPRPQLDGDDRFLFPSVDGAELLSRWDMHSHPPDILITNVSMLGAMLNREVDESIFEKTREWLTSTADAYFYLVLDELHLQRGAAGTEVAYLLRYLLHRLGLSAREHRHKVRILASSASLPADGEEAVRSERYLRDMFGSFGTWSTQGGSTRDTSVWASAIVPGESEPELAVGRDTLPTQPFVEFLRRHHGTATDPAGTATSEGATSEGTPLDDPSWRDVASALGVLHEGALADVVRAAIEESGRRLANACWSDADGRPRAEETLTLAKLLFGADDLIAAEALRGMLVLRGFGDLFPRWFPNEHAAAPLSAPSFRLHTFFRSIEGLYAPLDRGASSHPTFQSAGRKVGRLSIERAASLGLARELIEDHDPPPRLLEVLYCECCGELYVGGMRRVRSNSEFELLPSEAELDGLPDAAAGQRFEDLSFEQYCVFWPTDSSAVPSIADTQGDRTPESWAKAYLDPATGVVRVQSLTAKVLPHHVQGWMFKRAERQDRHRRTNQHRGTNVPYECPACESDYSLRRIDGNARLSPIRHFRTGFAKTTQLLASELFHLLKLHTSANAASPKLVSFSDSRQDAAKAALDVESRHHEDVRRDVLVNALRAAKSSLPSPAAADARIAELRACRRAAEDQDDVVEERRLSLEIEHAQREKLDATDGTVRIGAILERPNVDRLTGALESRQRLKSLIAAFVRLGIHPVHPAGTHRFSAEAEGETRWFEWHELFTRQGDEVDWRDDLQNQRWLDIARVKLVEQMQKLVTEILCSRTYFSLEEAGLGYLCVSKASVETNQREYETVCAFLRVFGDAYRLLDSPYERPGPWKDASAVGKSNKVRRFAEAIWGVAEAHQRLESLLTVFHAAGHGDGLLATGSFRVALVSMNDPFWRCEKCARVHLHRGAERCTRCFEGLPLAASGVVSEIVAANFLSKRLERPGAAAFRLHCEELTGQTEDGPDRQRKFRGILLPQFRQKRGANRKALKDENGDVVLEQADPFFLPEREEIDLLAVTTTMEVGIDIGPLQAILQANMPPQRFNYQQRVGRAGRRRQAFSFVLTVCRTKSHDLYYFREPRKITGDVPPPPFLTKGMRTIARRFLRKWWLNAAFASMRAAAALPWPADEMRPPDIHGEFMPTELYFSGDWRGQLSHALSETEHQALEFVKVLCEESALSVPDVWSDAGSMLEELDELANRAESRRDGLAHSLAEQGNLPMYGMPTRVRDVFIEAREDRATRQNEWVKIDRDLDLAIFEFAPGAVIVKDKHEHRCVGFTGPLPTFRFKRAPGDLVKPRSPGLGEPFWMLQCGNCTSWFRFDTIPDENVGDCRSCGESLEPGRSRESREPLGFRTDFRPSTDANSDKPSGRHRSIQSEPGPLDFAACPESNLRIRVAPQIKTYRLNRGALDPKQRGSWLGFSASLGAERIVRRRGNQALLTDQLLADDQLDALTPHGPRMDFERYVGEQAQQVQGVWLAAPKTTDAMYLSPNANPPGLSIERVVGQRSLDDADDDQVLDALGRTAVRAAALSATFILVNRAALKLDVDPEEFDVIDPRLFRPAGGTSVPVLQFADHLVNGAGFCVALGTPDPVTGIPLIATLLKSVLTDTHEYPLNEFLRDDHERSCEQGCYRCLLRYRNQPYHGLLDWRLGLAFLHALADGSYRCGLDGNFESPALRTWPALVERDVWRLQRQFTGVKSRSVGHLQAVRFDRSLRWGIVAHPLWDMAAPAGLLAEAISELDAEPFVVVDSFNLARRPLSIRRVVEGG